MLLKAREPGERHDHYRLSNDLWYETIVERTELLRRWEQALTEGIELLGAEGPAGRRLEETRAFFAFLEDEMPALLERWRAVRPRPG